MLQSIPELHQGMRRLSKVGSTFIYVCVPGVTTLSRDFYRRPILGASNHFYSVESFIAGVRKTQGNI